MVSLHVPLTPETERTDRRGCAGAHEARRVLINTARGGLVDQAALIEALSDGHLAGAGLDVFETNLRMRGRRCSGCQTSW